VFSVTDIIIWFTDYVWLIYVYIKAILYLIICLMSTLFYTCCTGRDEHDHDQDLVAMDALGHQEEEGLALLIIEDPG